MQSVACSLCLLLGSCPGLQVAISLHANNNNNIIIITCNVRFRICVWVIYKLPIRLLFLSSVEYSCCGRTLESLSQMLLISRAKVQVNTS